MSSIVRVPYSSRSHLTRLEPRGAGMRDVASDILCKCMIIMCGDIYCTTTLNSSPQQKPVNTGSEPECQSCPFP